MVKSKKQSTIFIFLSPPKSSRIYGVVNSNFIYEKTNNIELFKFDCSRKWSNCGRLFSEIVLHFMTFDYSSRYRIRSYELLIVGGIFWQMFRALKDQDTQGSGVNFTNVLRAAFALVDTKSAKKTVRLNSFFALLGSASVKAARRTLVKLNPGHAVKSSYVNQIRRNQLYEELDVRICIVTILSPNSVLMEAN